MDATASRPPNRRYSKLHFILESAQSLRQCNFHRLSYFSCILLFVWLRAVLIMIHSFSGRQRYAWKFSVSNASPSRISVIPRREAQDQACGHDRPAPRAHERGDAQYLHCEIKRMVEKVGSNGVVAYCMSLDPRADQYVQCIFGAMNCMVVDQLARLPE